MDVSECPNDVRDVDAAGNPGVLIHVAWVIVVNEIEPDCLTENGPYKHCQSNADADVLPKLASLLENG